MQQARRIDRRGFLKGAGRLAAGAVAMPYVVRPSALGKAGSVAPSDRIVMGSIGVGGRGGALLSGFLGLSDPQVVAVCDVKQPAREGARDRVNQRYGNTDCAAYTDFRELIARGDIDAVVIASPDHW
ncbi:MAG TPA: twin-arginine translocation signal domain-containing protein, partial [Phycisphaerae bacterium]|nr:twin-arginine translocation signal domain-containing protein [Phycisphaerae bacterium]